VRTCAKIDPAWVEPLAAHLVKRTYSEPGWDRQTGSATAVEKVSLFGLTIVPGRRVCYGPIDPARSRELMIRHGLVEGEIDLDAEFFLHNRKLVEEVETWQRKLRRQDLFVGEWECFEFYDRRIPADVYDVVDGEPPSQP
jgi:ATP-dependent helicase HrpA